MFMFGDTGRLPVDHCLSSLYSADTTTKVTRSSSADEIANVNFF